MDTKQDEPTGPDAPYCRGCGRGLDDVARNGHDTTCPLDPNSFNARYAIALEQDVMPF